MSDQSVVIIALRIDDVSVHVCPHLPLILAFQTIENVHLKSLESPYRFVCPHFGSINSNCALRYYEIRSKGILHKLNWYLFNYYQLEKVLVLMHKYIARPFSPIPYHQI